MPTNTEILAERKRRIQSAIALEKTDRVPVVPLGIYFAPRMLGVKTSEYCVNPELAYKTTLQAFTGLGEIDGIQHAVYSVHLLSFIWNARVKLPGRELPEGDVAQMDEVPLMTREDYDRIIDHGYQKFIDDYYMERLDNLWGLLQPFLTTMPVAIKAWEDRGIPVLSPVVMTIPYEIFCGGRSLKEFMVDLYQIPDKVQAAMDAALPYLIGLSKQVIQNFGLTGIWLGGWRAASEFLSPRLWERFVFPYYVQMAQAVIDEGVTPVFHFDSSWNRDLAYLRQLPKGKCILSTDGQTDIYRAKEVLGDHMCLMGDVTARMFTLGTPDEVYEYSSRLVRDLGPTGFILGQGCDIPINAKPENVKAMIAAVH